MFHKLKRFATFAITKTFMLMRLETQSFNKKREAVDFVNAHGIKKEDIVAFFQETNGTFTIMYYAE